MKRMGVVLMMALLLAGCGVKDTFETVGDEMIQSVMAQPKEILLELQEDTLLPAMETDNGLLYLCRDYDVAVQTMEGGDLDRTLQTVTGQDRDDLEVLQTQTGDLDSYEFVWTAAGELGEQVCRGMILDDGTYHYVLTAIADADIAEEYREMWNALFESFGLS